MCLSSFYLPLYTKYHFLIQASNTLYQPQTTSALRKNTTSTPPCSTLLRGRYQTTLSLTYNVIKPSIHPRSTFPTDAHPLPHFPQSSFNAQQPQTKLPPVEGCFPRDVIPTPKISSSRRRQGDWAPWWGGYGYGQAV